MNYATKPPINKISPSPLSSEALDTLQIFLQSLKNDLQAINLKQDDFLSRQAHWLVSFIRAEQPLAKFDQVINEYNASCQKFQQACHQAQSLATLSTLHPDDAQQYLDKLQKSYTEWHAALQKVITTAPQHLTHIPEYVQATLNHADLLQTNTSPKISQSITTIAKQSHFLQAIRKSTQAFIQYDYANHTLDMAELTHQECIWLYELNAELKGKNLTTASLSQALKQLALRHIPFPTETDTAIRLLQYVAPLAQTDNDVIASPMQSSEWQTLSNTHTNNLTNKDQEILKKFDEQYKPLAASLHYSQILLNTTSSTIESLSNQRTKLQISKNNDANHATQTRLLFSLQKYYALSFSENDLSQQDKNAYIDYASTQEPQIKQILLNHLQQHHPQQAIDHNEQLTKHLGFLTNTISADTITSLTEVNKEYQELNNNNKNNIYLLAKACALSREKWQQQLNKQANYLNNPILFRQDPNICIPFFLNRLVLVKQYQFDLSRLITALSSAPHLVNPLKAEQAILDSEYILLNQLENTNNALSTPNRRLNLIQNTLYTQQKLAQRLPDQITVKQQDIKLCIAQANQKFYQLRSQILEDNIE